MYEAAKRIFEASKKGERASEQSYNSIEEVQEANTARLASDMKRYQQYYGINYLEKDHYDLVIDTTHKTPEEILKIILRALDEQR
jgi:CMP/dCMP kinase